MKKIFFISAILSWISLISTPLNACGYGYHLLHHLVGREVITYSSAKLISEDPQQGRVYEIKVAEVLNGSLKKGTKIRVSCEDIMRPEACKLEGRTSPFLFVKKVANKSQPTKNNSKPVTYRFHPNDGNALDAKDRMAIKDFIKYQNKLPNLLTYHRRTTKPYLKASLCALMMEKNPDHAALPPCLQEVLAGKSIPDQDAVLRIASGGSAKFVKNKGPLCNLVKGHFNQANSNLINEAELGLRTALGCSDNAAWLLSELQKGTNEFVTMRIPYELAFTGDAGAVKTAVEYFEKNPSKLTTVVLDQIAYALFATKQCDLMDEYIEKGKKQLLGLQAYLPSGWMEGYADNPDWDSIAQHYTRCKGHQPGKGEQLVSLLTDSPKDWPFPTKGGKVSFRIQQQAITSLEMQMARKSISPDHAGLKEAMADQMMNGHPQVVPEAMHFLKKYYSNPEIDAQIMQVALKADAKKYWQSHAIMAFMESGQKEKAIQIASASRFKQIKKIGALLGRKGK